MGERTNGIEDSHNETRLDVEIIVLKRSQRSVVVASKDMNNNRLFTIRL